MCSVGAATTALAGRGTRPSEQADKDYDIVLPTLPTGRVVLNTLFLHGDVRVRPYRVEDFREAIINSGALPDIVALGAYQLNHVWAVTFNSAEATKKFAALKALNVKGRRCLIFDPEDQQVKLRLHWMLPGVQDEDIRTAFAAFGKVTEVTRERWRVESFSGKGSTTRIVLLKLKPGMKVDDLPHQVRVAGQLGLVVVPGRPMQCLRCHGTGHVRRDCKVPRCTTCKRYGHADADCVRTYASATALGTAQGNAELMDVAKAEDAASGNDETGKLAVTADTSVVTVGDARAEERPASQPPAPDTSEADEKDAVANSAPAPTVEEPKEEDNATQETSGARPAASVTAAAKRPHTQTASDVDQAAENGVEEPPAKAAQARRSSLRRRSNVSADMGAVDKEPPDHCHVPDGSSRV